MNNKGFAISTMLYGLIIIIALVMIMILSTMAFNRKSSREFTSTITWELENFPKASDVGYSNVNTGLKDTIGNDCIETQCALDALARIILNG